MTYLIRLYRKYGLPLVNGIGNLSLFLPQIRYQHKTIQEAWDQDGKSLASDWGQVGDDFRKVLDSKDLEEKLKKNKKYQV